MPRHMEEGFVKADARNLPDISSHQLAQFFNSANFLAPEMKNVKTSRSSRAEYSDEAVGFVQLKRDKNICHVMATVTPEHRVSMVQPYKVHCLIDENEEVILKAFCSDCAACQGGCKHAVAFVTWLHRRSKDPAVTSVECYWKKSLLSATSSKKILPVAEIAQPSTSAVDEVAVTSFFDFVEANVSKPSMFFKNKEYCSSLSMHHLIMDWMRGNPGSSDGQAFLSFCTQAMQRANLSTILKDTEGQSSSSLWHDLRYARITASKLYEASRCSTESGSLVNTILGAQKVKDTTAMERGRTLEPIVCGMVEQKYAQKVSHVGLALNEEYPMFGASPDGVMGDFVIEIKCPMSEKTFKTYFDSSMTKPSSKYLTQVMLQMLFLNKRKGLFCVALPNFEKEKKIKILEVLYDSDFMQSTLAQASQFWLKAIFPKLNKDLMPPQLLPLLDSN